jgi:hypothetical protein
LESPSLELHILAKHFSRQPLLVWYEKRTITLVCVFLGLWFLARTKPTKNVCEIVFTKSENHKSLFFQPKKVCGKRVSGTKVTAHPICSVLLFFGKKVANIMKTPHIG